jgi:hypothetical protein
LDRVAAIKYGVSPVPEVNVSSRKTEVLRTALKEISDTAARLKEAGLDDLATELHGTMSRVRRELNHVVAVKNHPDLFG